MDPASTTYRVHKCSKCPGGTEYYCESCPCDLCQKCKQNHVKNLKTIDHTVATYRDKFNYIPKQELCVRHPSNVYRKYCEPCQVPVCDSCFGHKSHRFPVSLFRQSKHKTLSLRGAYKPKQQQHRGTIHSIRSEALFYRPVLLTGITDDIKTCRTEFSRYQSEMSTKAQKLKDLINYVLYDLLNNVLCDFNFKHRCLKQKIETNRLIVSLQRYVHMYEQSTFSALQFLSSIKTALTQIHLTLHTSQLSMTESLNKEDVMESLSIQITERGNRRVGNQCLLKLTSGAEFHQSLTLTGVHWCSHISFVTSDRVWVSDGSNNLMLTDTTGVPLHRVKDSWSDLFGTGSHTVNSESELIYIDRNYNINKLSKDMKTTTTFIERTDFTLELQCVYWSPSTGDLLVGMYNNDIYTGKVTRYNQSGQLTHTIQNNNTGRGLYSRPLYITENNNGDVVVSDRRAVVVTERGGRHRFSYTRHPSGSGLDPHGICTDALSHIVVCDWRTHTVQMLDSDGQFLSHLLIRPSGIFFPYSLSYDVNTHRLWVGSGETKTVVIYRYITRQDTLTDTADKLHTSQLSMTESLNKEDVMESLSAIQITERGNRRVGNQCLLKLTSGAELHQSLTVTGVGGCDHISCVTSDRVWVSDDEYNLMLTDTTGVPLHRVEDSCRGDIFGNGLHTVNSESELIYIDRNYNIKKRSKDMKTTKTLIKKTIFSKWEPRCVYWSPSTGDLLVGMYNDDTYTGKVTRYNQSGQLTQTIQNDNTGLGLYREPDYITENNNRDVVVSDNGSAVVVTERGGRHRFSYTGHPSGSGLQPRGICTDALSHILVCDYRTNTVQMLDRDGQFLSHLLTKSQEMGEPQSLSYDVNTHRLWVGSQDNNKVFVYSYIDTQDALTDEDTYSRDEDVFYSSTPAVEWR
uniref:Tripartite motif-containing protein 3 n=1 Tax=Magallana gigas TaxID=29159 RepID=K1PQI9_MAGGI